MSDPVMRQVTGAYMCDKSAVCEHNLRVNTNYITHYIVSIKLAMNASRHFLAYWDQRVAAKLGRNTAASILEFRDIAEKDISFHLSQH